MLGCFLLGSRGRMLPLASDVRRARFARPSSEFGSACSSSSAHKFDLDRNTNQRNKPPWRFLSFSPFCWPMSTRLLPSVKYEVSSLSAKLAVSLTRRTRRAVWMTKKMTKMTKHPRSVIANQVRPTDPQALAPWYLRHRLTFSCVWQKSPKMSTNSSARARLKTKPKKLSKTDWFTSSWTMVSTPSSHL